MLYGNEIKLRRVSGLIKVQHCVLSKDKETLEVMADYNLACDIEVKRVALSDLGLGSL